MAQQSSKGNLLERYTSRRFLLTVAGLVISAWQLCSEQIDQTQYVVLIGVLVVPYLTASTTQHVMGSKKDADQADS